MADRGLLLHERVLIAAVVTLGAARRVDDMVRIDLLRLMSACDAVAGLPADVRFQIEHGPISDLYLAAVDLIKAHRASPADPYNQRRCARLLDAALFAYFEPRCIAGLRDIGVSVADIGAQVP